MNGTIIVNGEQFDVEGQEWIDGVDWCCNAVVIRVSDKQTMPLTGKIPISAMRGGKRALQAEQFELFIKDQILANWLCPVCDGNAISCEFYRQPLGHKTACVKLARKS